ncbi:MAG: zinc ribbon domain-containing protein [Deltaproteobacteria bacterium]|nr:MAG: zinc ribbon domain-containing protein [Deltaproteobacteria bacterium]
MPIYEYRCENCGRRSSFLVLKVRDFRPLCKHCGGENLTKLISRVAFLRSEEGRWERLADPSRLGDFDERDPRSMARWMKKMGKELGEDVGEDFDQMVEEAMEEEGGGTQEDLL